MIATIEDSTFLVNFNGNYIIAKFRSIQTLGSNSFQVKDNFSEQSIDYQRFRPCYPDPLIKSIVALTSKKERALDCGTGNGQLAVQLLPYFKQVFATDISQKQLEQAAKPDEIKYTQQPAEKTDFPDHYFDLITVGQAAHWFDFEKFYLEIHRVSKASGVLALIGYQLLRINPNIDPVIDVFYADTIGKYWDAERKHVDQQYQSIPFPFHEVKIEQFTHTTLWKFHDLLGYLSTWSALNHFIKTNKYDPLEDLVPLLKKQWGSSDYLVVNFPIFTRIGRV
ncbi:MAG: class I SAM-dependent methyltransferase [Saprospiraceae bacterium]|nr:class I SAM-dependent methyltransferase [Saprospiraceae bacterium]